jgi:hypothetical protein
MGRERHRESGLSLVELVVAMTILSLATIVALSIYDEARRAYAVGENLAEQQQIARIGFDIISTDLRGAGFNINPDGNIDRPDEAIEGAFATALVVRGDFDYGDPVESIAPEATLTAGPYLTVTTGNDEIRAYVLAKSDGSSSETLTYFADVAGLQRNGVVERIDINNVAMTQNDPPYTLYRIQLDNDLGATPRRIAMVDNVRRLEFRYFDQAGNEVTPSGGDDTLAFIRDRASIRRVEIALESLTRDPDTRWEDVDDVDPDTRRFRKYELVGDVTPRNVGKTGIKDFQSDVVPPSRPTPSPSVFPGHCRGLFIRWNPNPPADEVAYYRIHYRSTNPITGISERSTGDTWYYLGSLLDGVEYEIAIQAVDAAGNRSTRSGWARRTTINTNTPSPPQNPAVVDTGSGLEVTWEAVQTNTGVTAGDLESPMIRELAGYRLYRSTQPGFSPSAGTLYADTDVLPPLAAPYFLDTQLASCTRYYYVVRAVDECGRESGDSDESYGDGPVGAEPAIPDDDFAYFDDGGVMLTWSPVSTDVGGNPLFVDTYEIWRSDFTDVGIRPPKPGGYIYHLPPVTGGQTWFFDPIVVPPAKEVHYIVRAQDGCGTVSDWSSRASPTCNFDGLLEFTKPMNLETIFGPTGVGLGINGVPASLADYLETRFTYSHEEALQADLTVIVPGPAVAGSPPYFETNWDAQPAAGFAEGWYRVTAEVVQVDGVATCIARKAIRVLVDDGL